MHVFYRSPTILKQLSFHVQMRRGENSYRFLLKGETYIRVSRYVAGKRLRNTHLIMNTRDLKLTGIYKCALFPSYLRLPPY